jgi:hypothetical protein
MLRLQPNPLIELSAPFSVIFSGRVYPCCFLKLLGFIRVVCWKLFFLCYWSPVLYDFATSTRVSFFVFFTSNTYPTGDICACLRIFLTVFLAKLVLTLRTLRNRRGFHVRMRHRPSTRCQPLLSFHHRLTLHSAIQPLHILYNSPLSAVHCSQLSLALQCFHSHYLLLLSLLSALLVSKHTKQATRHTKPTPS